jgi:hypothetical protein
VGAGDGAGVPGCAVGAGGAAPGVGVQGAPGGTAPGGDGGCACPWELANEESSDRTNADESAAKIEEEVRIGFLSECGVAFQR